jgi:coenzyme F420 hydrogenase subunit beta
MIANNLLEKITTSGYCTGCGLCASVAEPNQIKMQINASGFLRPVIQHAISVESDAAIKHLCPGIHLEHPAQVQNKHPIWGPLVKVRTGFAQDAEIQHLGSSGGVISALAAYLLESGKVDFVAQTAVSKTEPLVNILQKSFTREDVLHAAGSRYAPSSPLENIRELFQSGQTFAFIGKPCDVAGLRAYIAKNPQYKHQIKYMISFMCAGVPSIHGSKEVIAKMGADINQLVSFRYRGDGWPGKARAVQADGQSFEMDYNSSWGNILGKQIQFRCKLCADGTGEFADIVCADAWYGKDGYPDFAEREGRSLLLTRTEAGEHLINEAIHAVSIQVSPLDVGEISKMQPYQVNRKKVVLGRVLAAGLAHRYFIQYKNMGLVVASLATDPVTWFRHAWGTFKRVKGEVQ